MSLNDRMDKRLFFFLILMIFIIATHRFNLLLLFILPSYLSWKNGNRWCLVSSVLAFVLAVGWVLYASISMPALRSAVSTVDIIKFYITNPISVIKALWHTAMDWGLLKFYRNSFVGTLGWLDYSVNKYFIYLTHILLCCIFSLMFK